jgi:hypothetical protein
LDKYVKDLKHALIAGAILLVFWELGWRTINAYKDVQKNIAARDVKIEQNNATVKANEQTVTKAQTQVDTGLTAIHAGDAERDRKLNDLQAQLNSKPDSEQIKKIVQDAMPNLKGFQVITGADGKQYLSAPNTQENRDAINQQDVAFKSCKFSLDDCANARRTYETLIIPGYVQQITAMKGTIAAQNDTIALKDSDIKDLKRTAKGGNLLNRTLRVGVPIGCAGAGAYLAGKSQQGNNQGKAAAIGALAGGGACALIHF